jgi:predicted enzyme related to lactoylglutathione lyase
MTLAYDFANTREDAMKETGKINYLEIPSRDLEATKRFFTSAFGWSFIDYGPAYIAIENAGLDGGFFKSDNVVSPDNGSVLVVLYSSELEATAAKVTSAGGTITQAIFSFPGGRRFHFTDPTGNEYAVWSEPSA